MARNSRNEDTVYTTERTSKHLKAQLALVTLLFWAGLIWSIFAIVGIIEGHAEAKAAGAPAIMMICAALWLMVTKLKIWWHHE